jgi:putative transposase
VADVCRQLGVSEASFYLWKKKYAKLGLTEIRELRQLRDENARLKRLVGSSQSITRTAAYRIDH